MADIRPSTEIELELHDYIGSAYSPTVEVTETEDGHTVSITSRKASGIVTDEFDVKDGFDPVATVARGDHKAVLTVTDKFGTTTADIPDGVSPRVEITEDDDGHTVSITDAYGTHSYDVPDWSGDERERVEAEERRVAAETARSTAESQRVAAESQRASAETARKSAENARSAAEGTRVQSESQRAANEIQRAAGEVQRGLNEQARVASETAREAAWETMSADVLSATDDANEAAATAMGVSVSMLGNTAHTTITGTSVHVSDAISFPPVGLSVHGASVQSGTPSTASPKPISHVTSATVRVTDGWSVPVDLDGNVLRSAGGAVDDIVELSYAGVGATEGTAVYDVTLHANVGTVTLNGTEEWSLSSLGLLRTTAISDLVRLPKSTTELIPLTCTQAVATSYADLRSTTGSIAIAESGNVFVNLPSITTVGAIRTWLSNHPMTVVYPLATPSETSLGRVTLQSLPAPEFTMTVDGGAVQAPFDLSYVYDVSIAEQERAEEWLSLKSDAVQATSDAGSAATSATTAAASASAAATNANATASSISAAAARGDFDGYSPTVAIADTELGHTVTITDRQGPHAYTVPTYADEEQARQDAWDQLSQDAQEAIDAATEAAESVSDDVDALYNGIDMLRSEIRTAEVEGGVSQVENAAKAVPVDLAVYGNSTQDGTPTPDVPVAIKSVDAPALTMVGGKNVFDSSLLLKASYTSFDGEYYNTDGYWLDKGFPRASGGFPVPIYGQQAVLSFDGMNKSGTESTQGLNFVFEYTDGTTQSVKVQGLTLTHYSMVSNPSKTLKALIFSYNTNVSAKIKNIQLEYGTEATAYEPYSGVTAPIDLQDHELRSLPDGTKDRLDLTYDRPSKRAGWAWYKASIKAGTLKLTKDSGFSQFQQVGSTSHNRVRFAVANSMGAVSHSACNSFVYNSSTYNYGAPGDYYISSGYAYFVVPDSITSLTDANAWLSENPITLVYTNASGSTTIQLEDIELPVIPTDHATVYVTGGSAQPTWHMDYQIDADAELVQVHAELDEARAQVAQLFGNQLVDELSGTIDTASDAYAAPPMALTVDGASTQVTTTGKNLLNPDLSTWNGIRISSNTVVSSGGTYYKYFAIPLEVGQSVHWHRNSLAKFGGYIKCCSTYPPEVNSTITESQTITNYADYTVTGAEDKLCMMLLATSAGLPSQDEMNAMEPQIEYGTAFTSYEPYSGGKTSPSPDWPQPILSVDALGLVIRGANLFDVDNADFLNGSYFNNSGNVYSSTYARLTKAYTPVVGGAAYTLSYYKEDTPQISCGVMFYESNKDFVSGTTFEITAPIGAKSVTFTTPANARYIRFHLSLNSSNIQLEIGSTATAYEPYQVTTVSLYDGDLRSLPDGTKDELHLSYLRPSTRPGWAWYSREVTRYTGAITYQDGGFTAVADSGSQKGFCRLKPSDVDYTGSLSSPYISNRFVRGSNSRPNNTIYNYHGNLVCLTEDVSVVPSGLTAEGLAEFNAWNLTHPIDVVYRRQTPTTETLSEIELPELPAPNATVFCDGGSAQPTYQMQYVRDTNIVIGELRAALADLATS